MTSSTWLFFYLQLDLVNVLQISIGMDSSTLGCLGNEEKMTFIKGKSESPDECRPEISFKNNILDVGVRRPTFSSSLFRQFIRLKQSRLRP